MYTFVYRCIQPFSNFEQSAVPSLVLTVGFLICIQVSQTAGKMVWYPYLFKNFPQFVVIQTVKVFSVVNEAEVDVFLEFSSFFYDPMDVGKSQLCIGLAIPFLHLISTNTTLGEGRTSYLYHQVKKTKSPRPLTELAKNKISLSFCPRFKRH